MKNYLSIACAILIACNPKAKNPSPETIESINLKKGNLIWCGPEMANFGSVNFVVSANDETKKDFNQAVAILHSFEYDEAEKAFANVIEKDPSCAMAYWGVAMSNFHPLWEPPKENELKKGARAIEIAQTIKDKTTREADYINAMSVFYKDWNTVDHKTRCKNYQFRQ